MLGCEETLVIPVRGAPYPGVLNLVISLELST